MFKGNLSSTIGKWCLVVAFGSSFLSWTWVSRQCQTLSQYLGVQQFKLMIALHVHTNIRLLSILGRLPRMVNLLYLLERFNAPSKSAKLLWVIIRNCQCRGLLWCDVLCWLSTAAFQGWWCKICSSIRTLCRWLATGWCSIGRRCCRVMKSVKQGRVQWWLCTYCADWAISCMYRS